MSCAEMIKKIDRVLQLGMIDENPNMGPFGKLDNFPNDINEGIENLAERKRFLLKELSKGNHEVASQVHRENKMLRIRKENKEREKGAATLEK